MSVLIAGGTGRLGHLLVHSLTAEGRAVRVLTRDPAAADVVRAAGADAVVGDLRNPADVARAVEGCEQVVAAASGFGPMGSSTPVNVDRDGNIRLITAARDAGCEHVVLLSMRGAAVDAPLELLRMKAAAEQVLSSSGVRSTVIRPSAFLETYLEVVAKPMPRRGATLVFGDGRKSIGFVSVVDVAAAVCAALRGDPGFHDRVLEWGGLNLTLNDLSDAIHEAAGRPGRTIHVPLSVLRVASVAARPFSAFAARVATAAIDLVTRQDDDDSVMTRAEHPEIPVTSLAHALAAAQATPSSRENGADAGRASGDRRPRP